jgi:hypothetical protein
MISERAHQMAELMGSIAEPPNRTTWRSAHLHIGGMLWPLKGQDGVQDDINVRVELHHRQVTSHFLFTKPGLRTAFTATRVAIETDAGEVVEERVNPRDSFAGHVLETPWDRLQLAYFHGYTMWNYLTTPFSFATPRVPHRGTGALAGGRSDLAPFEGDVPGPHRGPQ